MFEDFTYYGSSKKKKPLSSPINEKLYLFIKDLHLPYGFEVWEKLPKTRLTLLTRFSDECPKIIINFSNFETTDHNFLILYQFYKFPCLV